MTKKETISSPWALLAAIAALYVPFAFLGYGSDRDAYSVMRVGRRLIRDGVYDMSRHPGYLVHEVATGMLDGLGRGLGVGGSLATNLGTVALALVAVGAFHGALRRLAVPRPTVLAAGFALHPALWPVAATTMDYAWALALLLAGWVALLDRRWAWGGVLLGLAVGARFTSALAVPALVVHATWGARRNDTGGVFVHPAFPALGLAAALGAACYLPAAAEAGWTLNFLRPAGMGEALWTPLLRVGRWGFKNLHVWGLTGSVALVGVAVWTLACGRAAFIGRGPLIALVTGVVIAYEVLFVAFPLESEYLIPIVPFVLLALGIALGRHPRVLAVVLSVVALHNAVSVSLARPDRPLAAQGAVLGPWIEPGTLVWDTWLRLHLRGCESAACADAATADALGVKR